MISEGVLSAVETPMILLHFSLTCCAGTRYRNCVEDGPRA